MKTEVSCLFERIKNFYKNIKALSVDQLDQILEYGYVGKVDSGAIVTGHTVHNFTAFFSGVSQISQTVASCPLILYMKTGETSKKPHKTHPVYSMLRDMVNPFMDSLTWKEMMQHHALVWGNAYSYIERDVAYRPIRLWPLYPQHMKVEVNNGIPVYKYREPEGREKTYRWDQIFHLRGFGFNGLQGYSMISLHREAIGLGLSQQEFAGRFLDNGGNIPGYIKYPGKLSEAAIENLGKAFKNRYGGTENAGKFPVLEQGAEIATLSMPLDDAQFLESRVFQIQEIARILNMPPHKLKDMSHATYTNIEHNQIEYRTDTIRPWAERWEKAIDTQLLTSKERANAFSQYDLSHLTRGDIVAEHTAYKEGRYGGYLNANEIRYKLGYNPIENEKIGETYWMPTNMQDAGNPTRKTIDNSERELDDATTETEEE
jgi:HK97 family phage portal protein